MSRKLQPPLQCWLSSSGFGLAFQRTTHHGQATRTTIRKSRCRRGTSPDHSKVITTQEEITNEHSRSANCHLSPNPHLHRAPATDSRRPAGPTSRMGRPQPASASSVTSTRHASGKCSTLWRAKVPTSLLCYVPKSEALIGKRNPLLVTKVKASIRPNCSSDPS